MTAPFSVVDCQANTIAMHSLILESPSRGSCFEDGNRVVAVP